MRPAEFVDRKGRLADFIGLGAQKSGTSWLWVQLRDRPDVFMPQKELDFFLADRPSGDYAAQFVNARPDQRTGDISPNYLHIPKCRRASRRSARTPGFSCCCTIPWREPSRNGAWRAASGRCGPTSRSARLSRPICA
jgi:hypothetical protein